MTTRRKRLQNSATTPLTLTAPSTSRNSAKSLNIRFPDGEYETLGGYIMDVLGRIPGEDEHPQIKYKKATFTVLEMDERRIGRVHIEVEPETGETQEEKED